VTFARSSATCRAGLRGRADCPGDSAGRSWQLAEPGRPCSGSAAPRPTSAARGSRWADLRGGGVSDSRRWTMSGAGRPGGRDVAATGLRDLLVGRGGGRGAASAAGPWSSHSGAWGGDSRRGTGGRFGTCATRPSDLWDRGIDTGHVPRAGHRPVSVRLALVILSGAVVQPGCPAARDEQPGHVDHLVASRCWGRGRRCGGRRLTPPRTACGRGAEQATTQACGSECPASLARPPLVPCGGREPSGDGELVGRAGGPSARWSRDRFHVKRRERPVGSDRTRRGEPERSDLPTAVLCGRTHSVSSRRTGLRVPRTAEPGHRDVGPRCRVNAPPSLPPGADRALSPGPTHTARRMCWPSRRAESCRRTGDSRRRTGRLALKDRPPRATGLAESRGAPLDRRVGVAGPAEPFRC
jgi:hypothetical protein